MTSKIQELINKRAEKRLDQELVDIWAVIRDSILGRTTDSTSPSISFSENGVTEGKQKPYWFFQPNKPFMLAVKKFWIDIYIEEETKMFVEKVDRLSEEVGMLMDNKTYE